MPFAPSLLARRALAGLAFVLIAGSPAPASAQSAFALPDLKLVAGGGTVLAIARQPDGRILIGGNFSVVSGEPRQGLARLLADGTLDTTWNPGTDGIVRAIAVSGSTIYVGGDFSTLGSAARANVGAVTDTGTVTAWNPGADSTVSALAVDGTDVVAGGSFSQLGGENRARLARITSAGAVTAWAPEPDGIVTALVPGPSAMIVGGQFSTLGGATRRGVALVDAAGVATAWNAGLNGNVSSIARDGDTAWLAGSFGAPRAGLAAVSLTSGAALAFDAQVAGGLQAVAVSGGVVYAGGQYFEAGGTPRNCFGAFDATTGALTAWYPDAGDTCEGHALAIAGTDVLVGGLFEQLGNVPALSFGLVSAAGVTAAAQSSVGRNGVQVHAIARLSDGRLVVGGRFRASGPTPRANLLRVLADGTLDPAFDPGTDDEVLALAAVGSTIYAGGFFRRIAGTARAFAGAVDGNGAFLPWTPPVTGGVLALATAPGKIYLAGEPGAGASPLSTLGRVDASTGTPDSWNPGVAMRVRAIAIGARLYAGGEFLEANGEARSRAAAFDLVTAAVTPWAPEPNGRVRSIVVDGARVYLGGDFSLPRPALAAVDATTGALQAWNPGASGIVFSMSLGGTVLYTVGGYLLGSTPPRNGLVAFDTLTDTGNVLAWNPAISGGASTILAGPSAVYVGGLFTSLGGAARQGLGALPLSGAPSPPSRLAILSINAGQPVLRDTNFAIVMQSQDAAGNPAAVAADTTLAFTVASGSGTLLAGVPCTLLAGQNTCSYTTQYNVAQGGVSVTASVASGDALTAATSGAFAVFGPSNVTFTLASTGIFVNGATSATITVTGASPTGTVTLRAGGTPVASCTAVALVAGAATCPVSGLAAGLYNVDATYSGDAVNAPAISPFDVSLTVAPLPLLQVAKAGTGSGGVTSNTGGIDCGATCQASFDPGTQVTLTATPAPGSVHTGWSGGGCSAAGACVVTMNTAVGVTARFELASVGLTVTISGPGAGTVSSTPAGLDCGATCTVPFVGSTVVTLTATPSASSTFAGWAGEGCSGTGTCVVTMDTVRNVQAGFVVASRTLTVALAGTGSGRVDSADTGISCGSDCTETYTHGTAVTLTPSAFVGSVFAGWSGACTGTGACVVTMDGGKSVTATFSPEDIVSHPLTVTKAGGGGGVVTSTPGGIDCGSTCSASFTSDTIVALGAAPASDSFFAGWSGGGCSGTGACNVTMTAARNVTATFKLNTTIPRLANISTRMQVLTGADVLIGGFIIGGTQAKTVVVRARGPSLTAAGVTGALANPVLQLFSGATQLEANDNWQQAANAATIQSSGFAPSDPLESAIYTTLSPGAYTAIVTGAGGGTGVSIIEVFEVDVPQVPLLNIATRGKVLTGGDVMIGGFIIQGDAPQTVLVRARGPSLTAAGVPGALQDTVLQLFAGAAVIASNDDWQSSPDAAVIQSSGFAPSDARESVIRITLNPGAYTAIVTGKNGTTGVGIIEVFAQ